MDELLIRQAPHSPEAEQAVLGSMLIDADCVKDVMDKLQPEDFYLRRNREIFETIYSMFVYSRRFCSGYARQSGGNHSLRGHRHHVGAAV